MIHWEAEKENHTVHDEGRAGVSSVHQEEVQIEESKGGWGLINNFFWWLLLLKYKNKIWKKRDSDDADADISINKYQFNKWSLRNTLNLPTSPFIYRRTIGLAQNYLTVNQTGTFLDVQGFLKQELRRSMEIRTSTILEQELRELGCQFGVWPWSPFWFVIGVGNT